jgi:dTDP-4-dehydrorhamnose reductase
VENQKTILVTGANGQLGSEIKSIAHNYESYNFLFVTKEDLPINNYEAVESFFQNKKIHFCINCAAYTAVDKAETDIDTAFAVNASGASNLAVFCEFYKVQLIHISTDYVFDGSALEPITETHPTNPLGVYGQSKLKGEYLVQNINPSAITIRTSWVYSSFGNNFVKTMLRLMAQRDSIGVVSDQFGKPTYAKDLAEVIMQIIIKINTEIDFNKTHNQPQAVFNYSNSGNAINWYDFACAIKESIKSKCEVNPIPTSAYPTPAKRPAYSVLNTDKIENTFGISIPNWKISLEKCLRELSN